MNCTMDAYLTKWLQKHAKGLRLAVFLLLCSFMAVQPVLAKAKAGPVSRTILALYDGRYDKEPSKTYIHRYLEMPLNHLGYMVAYHDINQNIPDVNSDPFSGSYAAILTWFSRPLEKMA